MGQETDYARGCYVSWKLARTCSEAVSRWCRSRGIVSPVATGDHHCTIMYSKEQGLDPSHHGDVPLPRPWRDGYTCVADEGPRRTDVLGPRDKKGALVVMLRSSVMAARHRYFRDECYLRHSFPDFIPHVTLSYDCDAQDPRVLLNVVREPIPIPLVFDVEHRDYCQ